MPNVRDPRHEELRQFGIDPVLLRSLHAIEDAEKLDAFVVESNMIEEKHRRAPLPVEVHAHQHLLALKELTVEDIETFVGLISTGRLRKDEGDNVYIRGSDHQIMPGGPAVVSELELLLWDVNKTGVKKHASRWDPFSVHVRYETLHPFTDGNGRSGRAIWLWQMTKLNRDPYALPFLHRAYYQALEAARR